MLALEATVSAISYITLPCFSANSSPPGFYCRKVNRRRCARSLLVWARASLLLFLCAAWLALLVQGAKLQHAFPSAELLWRYLTMTQSGKILVCTRSLRHRDVVGNLAAADKKRQPQGNLSPRSFGASIGRRAQSHESRGRGARRCCHRGDCRRDPSDRHGALGRRIGRPVADFLFRSSKPFISCANRASGATVFHVSPWLVSVCSLSPALIKVGYTSAVSIFCSTRNYGNVLAVEARAFLAHARASARSISCQPKRN